MTKHERKLNAARSPLKRLQAGLPASWYRDPVHHARELEAFWYGHWIAVAREEEFAAPGSYRIVSIGTQSLLLLRDADGVLCGFHNTCRHRGSVLCTEVQGSFAHGHITCPYHAWTYDLGGRLIATPRRMPTADFDMAKFSLHAVAVDSWGGFIFVHLGRGKVPSLNESLGDLPGQFRNYGFVGLRIGKRIVAEVRANWKLIAENFSECFHCPPVHPELCRVVTAYREAGAWGLSDGKEKTPEYLSGAATLTLDGSARIPPFCGLNPEERATLYVPWMAPPNLFLNVHPDYVNAHMLFPTGPESVTLVYDWLFEPDHMPKGKDLDHYVALWELTNQQDGRNCEWQQKGMQSREFRHGSYMPQEFDCYRFTQWVRTGLRRKIPS